LNSQQLVFQVKKLAWEHYSGIRVFILPASGDQRMQKFSGIYMGRRRRQACELEVNMEGSGEDSEPQVFATWTQELRRSILQTESKLFTHL
jgi:hypothetical protein